MDTSRFRPSTNIEDYRRRPYTANDVIEQCAIVAEKVLAETDDYQLGNYIAASIRRLKDERQA